MYPSANQGLGYLLANQGFGFYVVNQGCQGFLLVPSGSEYSQSGYGVFLSQSEAKGIPFP
jgi:hypothetical protein